MTTRGVTAVLLVAVLAGCAEVSGPGGAPAPGAPGAATTAYPAGETRRIVHVLNRIGYGPRTGDVERVRRLGLATYIERQLDPPPAETPAVEAALAELTTLGKSIPELLRDFPRPDPALLQRAASGQMRPEELREAIPPEKRPARIVAELQAAKVLRAVGSERQLLEVMVDFWMNHFNVFAYKGEVRWFVTSFERDAIRPHALGRFPDLVRATARHPAMLFYLDNWLSARPGFVITAGPNRGQPGGLNENYAR